MLSQPHTPDHKILIDLLLRIRTDDQTSKDVVFRLFVEFNRGSFMEVVDKETGK
jgi:hypothetical protein